MPQIDNGFAVAATNVSFKGMASYQCYAGFGFASGQPIETVVCTADGVWSYVPVCQGVLSLARVISRTDPKLFPSTLCSVPVSSTARGGERPRRRSSRSRPQLRYRRALRVRRRIPAIWLAGPTVPE